MFRTAGAVLTGTGDNCECVPREQMKDQTSYRYILHDETPYIFFKSLKEDHIFTDRAYICAKGNTTGGAKRVVTRYDYFVYQITNVQIQTAGSGITDTDCEVMFTVNGGIVTVDVKKGEQDNAILNYRALAALSVLQARQKQQLHLYTQINLRTIVPSPNDQDGPLTNNPANRNSVNFSNFSSTMSVLDILSPLSYASVLQEYLGGSRHGASISNQPVLTAKEVKDTKESSFSSESKSENKFENKTPSQVNSATPQQPQQGPVLPGESQPGQAQPTSSVSFTSN